MIESMQAKLELAAVSNLRAHVHGVQHIMHPWVQFRLDVAVCGLVGPGNCAQEKNDDEPTGNKQVSKNMQPK